MHLGVCIACARVAPTDVPKTENYNLHFLLHLPILLFHRLGNYHCHRVWAPPPRCSADIKKRSANIKKPQRRHYQSAAQTLQAQLNSQGVLDPKFPECKSNSATDEPATVLQFTILVDINFPYFMNLCLDNSVHFTERCFQFLALSLRTDSIWSHRNYENLVMKFYDLNWLFGDADS